MGEGKTNSRTNAGEGMERGSTMVVGRFMVIHGYTWLYFMVIHRLWFMVIMAIIHRFMVILHGYTSN